MFLIQKLNNLSVSFSQDRAPLAQLLPWHAVIGACHIPNLRSSQTVTLFLSINPLHADPIRFILPRYKDHKSNATQT